MLCPVFSIQHASSSPSHYSPLNSPAKSPVSHQPCSLPFPGLPLSAPSSLQSPTRRHPSLSLPTTSCFLTLSLCSSLASLRRGVFHHLLLAASWSRQSTLRSHSVCPPTLPFRRCNCLALHLTLLPSPSITHTIRNTWLFISCFNSPIYFCLLIHYLHLSLSTIAVRQHRCCTSPPLNKIKSLSMLRRSSWPSPCPTGRPNYRCP